MKVDFKKTEIAMFKALQMELCMPRWHHDGVNRRVFEPAVYHGYTMLALAHRDLGSWNLDISAHPLQSLHCSSLLLNLILSLIGSCFTMVLAFIEPNVESCGALLKFQSLSLTLRLVMQKNKPS